jgi:hypothetical protein
MKTRLAILLLRACRATLVSDGYRNGTGHDGALLDDLDFIIRVLDTRQYPRVEDFDTLVDLAHDEEVKHG